MLLLLRGLLSERAQLVHQSWGSISRAARSRRVTFLHSPDKQVLAKKSGRHMKYGGLQCHSCKVTAKVKIIISIICPLCYYYAGSFLPREITILSLYNLGCFMESCTLTIPLMYYCMDKTLRKKTVEFRSKGGYTTDLIDSKG